MDLEAEACEEDNSNENGATITGPPPRKKSRKNNEIQYEKQWMIPDPANNQTETILAGILYVMRIVCLWLCLLSAIGL